MSRTKPRTRDSSVQALTMPADRMNEVFPISLSRRVWIERDPLSRRRPGTNQTVCFADARTDTIPLMGEDILREFGRFRRRHLWVRGFDLFLEAAFVMT